MTPEQRTRRATIAALTRATRPDFDGRHATEAARATYRDSFLSGHECAICPRIDISEDLVEGERLKRADRLRRMHYLRLAGKSADSRRKGR